MKIRICRRWHTRVFPFAKLDIGRVFSVHSSVAMYLRAMHCAEPVREGSKTRLSVAEARLRIAGRWHRLRVELDESIMARCSFYRERDDLKFAIG